MKFHGAKRSGLSHKIPAYRIVPAPLTGIGWVAVERWDMEQMKYVHVTTERTQALAMDFIYSELRDEEELLTTKVCDSCGLRFPAEELVDYYDGTDTWQICPACNKEG